ncbi:DsrE family protein [Robertkochia aurantiaca]|uniref:DsrE family protein n=1 Tax=Robertkochia aurantiaca TaxID=2873700 RepID=UPI001CCD17F1|nr:DsrE family protein [Robertkochia sp. 3YJGBD-33]
MMRQVVLLFVLMIGYHAFAQESVRPVKIVFDVTSDNVKTQESAVRHIKMMSQAYPESEFEMVMYGGSIDMVLPGKSTVAADIEELSGRDNISFKVCEGTMKRHKIDKTALIPGVETVPDGILELVAKQKQGWGYIKEGGN